MAKEKGFAAEFKKFITRGSVIDLAVGVIIGGSFQSIVKSLVDDVIMPVISLATKGIDFTNLFIQLDGGEKYATLEAAREAGVAAIAYGNFISAILNFIIMAFVIFCFIRGINKVIDKTKKPEPEAAPTTKKCPFCCSDIPLDASRCPACTSELPEEGE